MNSLEKPEYLAYEKRTVYLAGKVTGLPRFWVVLKFGWYEFICRMTGLNVINPVKLIHKSCSYGQAMCTCIQLVGICDYIYMIPGWLNSLGAFREFKEAERLGIKLLNDTPRNIDRRESVKMMRAND